MCKFKHMKLMLYEVDGDTEEVDIQDEGGKEKEGKLKTLQLPLHSREGLTSNKSFNVWGYIGGRRYSLT